MSTAEGTIDEARDIVRKLVKYEKSLCGGNVQTALHEVVKNWDLEPGPVNSLWKNRLVKSIKGHILDRLREADEFLKILAEKHRQSLEETAATLERHNHPRARLARMAADAARQEAANG